MSIIDTIKKSLLGGENKSLPQPVGNMLGTFGLTEAPNIKTFDHLESYRTISWIYKAVKKNAEKVSDIELRLMRRGRDDTIQEVTEHPILELLGRVNNFMTFQDLVLMTSAYLELVGEAYWAKIRGNGGNVVELWPLRPDKVEVIRSDTEFIDGYVYKPSINNEVRFETDDVIYFKEFDPLNPFRGLGGVMSVAYAGDIELQSNKWNRNFFFNAATPLIAVIFEDNVGSESIERFKSKWEADHRGPDKSHKTAILKGIKEIKSDIQPSHKDMMFLDIKKANRDEIIAIFGVPRTVMGITEDVNRANAEATTATWLEHEIKPRMKRFVGTLNEFFIRDFDSTGQLFFDFVDPSPAKHEHLLNIYKAQGISWLTPNEIRVKTGEEPIDDDEMNMLWMPANRVPTGTPSEPTQEKQYKSGLGNTPFKKPEYTKYKKTVDKIMKNKGAFKEVMSGLMTRANKIKDVDEKKEKIWKQFISITDRFEDKVKDALRSLFTAQEQEVLLKLSEEKSVTKQIEQEPIVVDEWKVRFSDEIRPLIVQLVKTQGVLVDPDFSFTEDVQSFIAQEGLKFAKLVNETTRDKLKDTLSEGINEGEGADDLSQRVAEVFDEARSSRTDNIARSETIRASNFARVESYKQSDVQKYEWLTSLDSRVCPFCNSMDGNVIKTGGTFFEKGDELSVRDDSGNVRNLKFDEFEVAFPPLHPQCRCTTVPVVE